MSLMSAPPSRTEIGKKRSFIENSSNCYSTSPGSACGGFIRAWIVRASSGPNPAGVDSTEDQGQGEIRGPPFLWNSEWGNVRGKIFLGADMQEKQAIHRCPWLDLTKPDYVAYHDEEWGVPVHDDQRLFEFLVLEGAQAGLSWYTVLRKRENYRIAFDRFDPKKIAGYDERKMLELLANPGIIRNRAKIRSAINNAHQFMEIQEEFASFDAYVWRFVDGKPFVNELRQLEDYPATSRQSDALSKDLRQRGFSFVGSKVCYALMQATGLVNDHTIGCFRRDEILAGHSGGSFRPANRSLKSVE